jgi:hypothetical protein
MAKAWVEVEVESINLAREMIRNLSRDELFDFIVEIDEYAADWDITERLRDHFNGIKEES